MNDFLRHILNKLIDAIPLAVMAVVICAVGVAVAYLVFRAKFKGAKSFPLSKVILWLILSGYVAVVLSVTIMRYGDMRGYNLHLFRAWREAWNIFSFKNWANVLLNVAMFAPIGFLLPCILKVFRKWYVLLLGGSAFSLAIESVQGITGRGLFDVDDLFANTLGAFFGYGVYMSLRSVFVKTERRPVSIISYSAIPISVLTAISSIFIVYALKDYGNLQNAAVYRVNTKGVDWTSAVELSNVERTVPVYKLNTYNKNTCDAFGLGFLEGRAQKELDICYYDQETFYLDHWEHSLFVSHLDRTYEYSYHPNEGKCVPAEADRGTIEGLLSAYGIEIPKNATFSYDGEGWHRFVVPMEKADTTALGGELLCRYSSEGFIYVIHNYLMSYTCCAEEEIISEAEAFELLKDGKFLGGVFEMCSPENVEILSCELDYQVDTKGYYQPVYLFKVMYDGVEDEMKIMIPALH